MTGLNAQQQAAVRQTSHPLLVLAGAGSGKTRVITQKIAWLIEHEGMSARHIRAVTFTNKAAREMKERVAQCLPPHRLRGLWVSTFHTLGLNIIRKEASHLGFRNGLSLFDDADSLGLIKDIVHQDEQAPKDQAGFFQHRISQWKNDLVLPEAALSHAASNEELVAARIYQTYDRTLKACNAVDFDDLIMLPVLFFRQHRARLIHWQHQTRYLLVDEYQDANLAQYELVLLLAGPERRFTVVGDDDQSIYAWRGARPENLARLKADVPNLEVVMLEQNYRSSGRILRSANQLISNNPHIFEKTLWSEHGPGAPLRLMVCENEDDEASQIASDILLRHFTANRKYGDFAILFRSNHQARLMELKLREQQIPYTMTGGQGFFDRAEIRDLMAYLRLMSNPSDDSAFMRIINTPRRQIGPATLAALGETAASQGLSHFEAIYSPELDARLGADALARLRRFRQWLEQSACQIMGEGDTADALSRFLDDMAYQDWLASNASNRKVSDIRYENVMTLVQEIDRLAMDHEDGVAGALSQLALRDLLDRQEANDDSDSRVQLLTLHASKGLEFPVVYMMGMEEALLPHRNSIESDDIEEERRLAYVGITRAQYELVMTRCLTRKVRGERVECQPSRFIAELPLEDIQQEGRVAEDPEDDGCLDDIFAMARSMLD